MVNRRYGLTFFVWPQARAISFLRESAFMARFTVSLFT